MNTQRISVTFAGSDGATLSGRIELPGGTPRAWALFAHCFTCSKQSKAAAFISAALAARGIAVLRFDFTGLGASEGEFADTNFSSNVADLAAAADYLRREYQAPQLLIGHSLGGAAVVAAAPDLAEVRAVVTLNAPADPAHVLKNFAGAEETIRSEGEAEVKLGGRSFRIRRQFVEDVEGQRLAEALGSMDKALLVMHAPDDEIVDFDNGIRLFGEAAQPKSFVSLDGADHLLTRREDAAYVAEVLAAWAGRYVAPAAAQADDTTVRVEETREGKFTQRIVAGGHLLFADEPVSAGGLGSGPSPYDLLLAGLGACTAMTLRMYADMKKLPLERVQVELRHEKIHAQDCADCETKEGKVDRIERVIRLDGNLDAAQQQKLLEIANKCPVHRTLHGEVTVPTRLDAGEDS
ncbi:MAG: OsmC family protein [Rhodocyclaceae bacterium]|nr:OsmC family protein [Rhodocyclaceae bacterium]MCW5596808.1 OsmC family protein [Rhodocyclaceae bacterium]